MKAKNVIRYLTPMVVAGLLLATADGWSQGFRTQGLLLDDNATSLPTRNTISLLAPADGDLTGDYGIRFPNTTGLGVGSMFYVSAAGGTADLSWLPVATDGDILQLQGGVPTWQTLNLLPTGTVDNSTLRWSTAAQAWVENVNLLSDTAGNTTVAGTIQVDGASATINSGTITVPNVPVGVANDTNVVLRNANNDLVIRSINDLLDDATLSENAIWVGDASNNPIERAAGTADQVLQIATDGSPQWQTINLIPDGTVDNSTLRWDDATQAWVENVNLLSDTDGNTTINGTVEVNGATTTINSATVTVPNVPGGVANDTNVVLRNANNDLVIRSINDLLDDATLSENAIWVGDASNNPIERAAGTADQVLQIATDGSPQWQTINLIPDGTVDNSTLRWDDATQAWVENVNLLSDTDGNTTINGTVEVNGATTTINSATVTVPNVPGGVANDTNVVLRNANNDLVIRSINDLLDDATLSENAIWVGDASNNPIERAAGTADQVLQIATDGSPQWQTINLIPDGTVDNSTLRWDDATQAWVENVNLLSDTDGNTTINGTVEVNGATTTINSATVTVPNVPGGVANDTNVVLRNANNDLVIRSINDLLDDATLSENAIWVGDASNNPIERAAGTADQVLQIATDGSPQWQTINLIPDGTVDNSTLRWDDATQAWVENVNLLSDTDGNTTINGTTITTPNIPAGVNNDTNLVVRNASDQLVVRSINELIADATLTENAIWVGDANNNPVERQAGTTNQVLQIATDGSPQWQDINLVYRGRVATAGTITQVIPDVNVTAGGTLIVQYEDPNNGARIAVDVIARTASTDFTVGFSALPPSGTFINYTVMP
ncbi:MAG: hypothetical protein R3F28_04065 [Candidatus Kapaibacterium sp.]|nr:hypothetical protein [Ignavibacteria bacterium]